MEVKGVLTSEQIEKMQEEHSRKIAEIMPSLVEQVMSENPDIVNKERIRELAKSLAIEKLGVAPTSLHYLCPPKSSI